MEDSGGDGRWETGDGRREDGRRKTGDGTRQDQTGQTGAQTEPDGRREDGTGDGRRTQDMHLVASDYE
eukprot:4256220-Prymnesium_polylepis.1